SFCREPHRRRCTGRLTPDARCPARLCDARRCGRDAWRERSLDSRAARHGDVARWDDPRWTRRPRGAPFPRRDHRRGRAGHASSPRARCGVTPMGIVVLRQFTWAVASSLDWVLGMYLWIVLISALLSWVNPDPRNPIVRFLYGVTEPVLFQIRRRIPFVYASGIDFSPLILMVGIYFVRTVVVGSLYELARRITLEAGSWGPVV